MKISFLGLGAMGYQMARHLAKDHAVTVWNRTKSVAEKHAAECGTTYASTIDECGDADVVVSIVPTSREVDQLVAKLAPHLKRGTLWIDSTSGDPVVSHETAAKLHDIGIDFVDAPITGGKPAADAGTLTIMIGASDEMFEKARGVLSSCGSKIIHVGSVGMGHAIKAINNTMMAANMWIAAEGLMSLKKLGFDMKLALEVINGSSGRSNVTENLLPKRLVDGEWPLTFKLSLLDKDVRIASSLMHEQHISAPMFAVTSHLYTAALRNLQENADYIEVLKYVAKMNNEEW